MGDSVFPFISTCALVAMIVVMLIIVLAVSSIASSVGAALNPEPVVS